MDDYISRRDLLARYDTEHSGAPGRARELIEKAPAADVAPVVHARWDTWAGGGLYKCPVCSYEYLDYVECDNYCGNCGAKMDEEDNT